MYTYVCSAVVRDSLCSESIKAISDKQAWYLFSKKYGFKHRDFKAIRLEEKPQHVQLSFNI